MYSYFTLQIRERDRRHERLHLHVLALASPPPPRSSSFLNSPLYLLPFSYDVSNFTSDEGALKVFVNGCLHMRPSTPPYHPPHSFIISLHFQIRSRYVHSVTPDCRRAVSPTGSERRQLLPRCSFFQFSRTMVMSIISLPPMSHSLHSGPP